MAPRVFGAKVFHQDILSVRFGSCSAITLSCIFPRLIPYFSISATTSSPTRLVRFIHTNTDLWRQLPIYCRHGEEDWRVFHAEQPGLGLTE